MQKNAGWQKVSAVAPHPVQIAARRRKTPWPVRQGAILIDTVPQDFCRPYAPEEVWHIHRCLVAYDEAERAKGQRQGPIGYIGRDVLKLLLNAANALTGWLEPSIGWMAAELDRSVSGVHDAMKRLRDHGFLEWVTRRIDYRDDDEPGWNSVQTTSVYRIALPAKAEAIWQKIEARKLARAQAMAAAFPADMVVVIEDRIERQIATEAEWRAELKQRRIQSAREARRRMAEARLRGATERPPAPGYAALAMEIEPEIVAPARTGGTVMDDILKALASGTIRRGRNPWDA